MRDPLTFTPFTSFDSRTKEKEDVPPPQLLSQRVGFLLLLLPPPLLGLLYLHMPGSGTNQRAAWDALN